MVSPLRILKVSLMVKSPPNVPHRLQPPCQTARTHADLRGSF